MEKLKKKQEAQKQKKVPIKKARRKNSGKI
jgi:hypothetical protein